MDLKQVSSEYILLRESEEFLRRRLSQGHARKSFIPPGGDLPNVFFQDDDFQGVRDGMGILVHNEPEGAGDLSSSHHSASSSRRKIHTREGVFTFNPETVVVTDDFEVWWVTSPKWRRFIPLVCFFCIIVFLAHLIVASILFALDEDTVPNPYVCRTPNCLRIADWMKTSMNRSVVPCDDFYGYMCGRYQVDEDILQEHNAPQQLEMWMSSSATFGDDILAKVLRKPESNYVLKFYKSCLDERSRRAEGLRPFMDLLDQIRITSGKHNLNYIAARLSNFTGDFFFFDYWYGHGLTITVEPMSPTEIETIATGNAVQDLTNLFTVMSEAVEKIGNATGVSGPFKDGKLATTSIQALCTCIDAIYKNCTQGQMKTVTNLDKRLFDFKVALLVAEELGFSRLNSTYLYAKPSDSCFLDLDQGQLHVVPACLMTLHGFNAIRINFTYRVFWVLRVFQAFVNDLDDLTFQKIFKPNHTSELFSKAVEFRHSWIDIQCFQSLAANYGFLAFEAFAKDFETESAVNQIREFVRREQRILRKWVSTGKFSHLSAEDQRLLINSTSPESALNVIVAQKLYSFSDISSDVRHWSPDPKRYFVNVWKSRHLSEEEMTKDWFFSDTFSPWNTKVAADLLLGAQTTPAFRGTTNDNKDMIYLPLTMLTFPFFQKDFCVFNYAGIASIVAREVVRLSLSTPVVRNESSRTSSSFFTPSTNCECLVRPTRCQASYALHDPAQNCFDETLLNQFSSALAIKLGFEAFRHGDHYRSLVPKGQTQSSKAVEYTYRSGQGQSEDPKFHLYETKGKTFVRKEEVTQGQLRNNDTYDFHLEPKWLQGFEEFNQNQLFFMEFIRLHCYSSADYYKENVNSILAQVTEFAEVWSCPKNSKMVTTKPWFQK